MKQLLQKYRDMLVDLPLKNKIVALFLPLVTIPLIFLAILSSQIISAAGIGKAVVNSQDKLILISRQFNSMIDDVRYGVKIFSINNQIQELMKKPSYRGALEELAYTAKLNFSFTNLLNVSSFIKNAQIIMANGNVYDPYPNRIVYQPASVASATYRKAVNNIGQITILDPHVRGVRALPGQNGSLFITKAVIDITSGRNLGVVLIEISEDTLAAVYQGINNGRSGEYFIVNRQGYIVSSLDKSKLYASVRREPYFRWILAQKGNGRVFRIRWKEFLVTGAPLRRFANSDWYLVSKVPLSEVIAENYQVTAGIVIIALILAVLTLVTSYWLARSITTPLARLVTATTQISNGNLDTILYVNSKDEFGRLAYHFNTMVGDVRQLMVKNYLEQKKKREYELSLLQSQINPHFLYNTIENIRSLILDGQTASAEAMLANLGHFYKRVLSIGRDIISVREEIELTVSYMKIEQFRHATMFDYVIEIPETVWQAKIPKLTLQPLVENSINHGFRGWSQQGIIRIQSWVEANVILIEVWDNGKGITPEVSDYLFISQTQDSPHKNFGLKNIDERIKLQFGAEFGIKLVSQPGSGTTVQIRLPLMNEGVNLC